MSDDTNPGLSPEEIALNDDLTSEMMRLRPLAADPVAGADAADVADAEGAFEHDVEVLLAERDSFKDIALRL